MLTRFKGNPILKPLREHAWELERVFNCAVIYEGYKLHIVYRAMGVDGISRLGYACSNDGFNIEERLPNPVFEPAPHPFEQYGCEDPRLVKIEDMIIMTYTAYGKLARWRTASKIRLAQIGLTTIQVEDFLSKTWRWRDRIYPFPRVDNKNSFIFPQKFDGKYVMYHRISPHIWVGYSDSLEDWSRSYHKILMKPENAWEAVKIGSGAPVIETSEGWLLIYHGVDEEFTYRLGLALIDKHDPGRVIARLKQPILEPKESYEGRIVFTCGAIVLDGELLVYYGADDRTICVATADLSEVLSALEKCRVS